MPVLYSIAIAKESKLHINNLTNSPKMAPNKIQLGNITIDAQTGITDQDAALSRKEYGSNLLSEPKRTPWWIDLLHKFEDPTIIILLASAIISLIMTAIEKYVLGNPDVHFTESIGIFIAVFLAITVGFLANESPKASSRLLIKLKTTFQLK